MFLLRRPPKEINQAAIVGYVIQKEREGFMVEVAAAARGLARDPEAPDPKVMKWPNILSGKGWMAMLRLSVDEDDPDRRGWK